MVKKEGNRDKECSRIDIYMSWMDNPEPKQGKGQKIIRKRNGEMEATLSSECFRQRVGTASHRIWIA